MTDHDGHDHDEPMGDSQPPSMRFSEPRALPDDYAGKPADAENIAAQLPPVPDGMRRVIVVSPQVAAEHVDQVPLDYLRVLEQRVLAQVTGECPRCTSRTVSLGVDYAERTHLEVRHEDGCEIADEPLARIVQRLQFCGIRVDMGYVAVDVPDGAAAA